MTYLKVFMPSIHFNCMHALLVINKIFDQKEIMREKGRKEKKKPNTKSVRQTDKKKTFGCTTEDQKKERKKTKNTTCGDVWERFSLYVSVQTWKSVF